MKAAVVVANEDVQYQEVEEPKVTKGTVKLFWDMNFPVMW